MLGYTANKRAVRMLLECILVAFYFRWVRKGLKARSHGAIFLFATAMQKMDCVDVNEGVHMVRFHVCAMDWCVRCRTGIGSTPILCNCDVQFQCKYIGNCIQTHRTLWTKSLNRKQHSISLYNESQSHIAPCEWAFKPTIAWIVNGVDMVLNKATHNIN